MSGGHTKRTAYFDGDMFCYKVGCAAMKEVIIDEHIISMGDLAEAKVALDTWIEKVREQTNSDRVVIALTDKASYRQEIYPEYKANRRDKKKPMIVTELQNYCLENYKCEKVVGLEADDLLGIAGSRAYRTGEDVVLVSMDKDMRTIPGQHFNPDKELTVTNVTLRDATITLFVQILQGDSVDNYPGCKGIGEVKARRAIEEVSDEYPDYVHFVEQAWGVIVKAYSKAGQTMDDLYTNAYMARILWEDEYKPTPKSKHYGALLFEPMLLINYWRKLNGS